MAQNQFKNYMDQFVKKPFVDNDNSADLDTSNVVAIDTTADVKRILVGGSNKELNFVAQRLGELSANDFDSITSFDDRLKMVAAEIAALKAIEGAFEAALAEVEIAPQNIKKHEKDDDHLEIIQVAE